MTAEQNRAHHFGFAHPTNNLPNLPTYLDVETEAHQEPTLLVVDAFEATNALYEVTRRDSGVGVDVFFGRRAGMRCAGVGTTTMSGP